MKLIEVKNDHTYDPSFPKDMWSMVAYLNSLLKAMPEGLFTMLESSVPITPAALYDFPNLFGRSNKFDSGMTLTVLGLLGGFVNTDDYRLFAEFITKTDSDKLVSITRFGVFKVVADPA